jgi:two-component system, NtrC family, sensor kinase
MNAMQACARLDPPTDSRTSELESMCHAVVRALNVPAYLHRGGRILFANQSLERLLGYSQTGLLALPHDSLAIPEMQAAMARYGSSCLDNEPEPAATEMTLLTANGESRFVELIARRIDVGGEFVVLSTCQDLSDMRHVQTSLLNMSQVLNQILDNDPVATFVIDGDHRVTHWNRACEQLTGRDYWDMQGVAEKGGVFYGSERALLCDLLVDGADAQRLRELYGDKIRPSTLIDGAVEAEDFFPAMGCDGRWLFFTAAPLRNSAGDIVGAIETLQDVTLRRRAEEELTRHRNQLELLVGERTAELENTHRELTAFMENASVGILSSSDGKVLLHNKKFADMFVPGAASATGRPTRDFFRSEAEYESLVQDVYPTLASGKPFQRELMLQRLDGTALWVQVIAYASDLADPTAGAWWMVQDRSEVRRAQEALETNYGHLKEINSRLEEAQNQLLQSEKMASIGQLAAGVAHEINNPVGFVNSNLSSLGRYVTGLLKLVSAYEANENSLGSEMRRELERIKSEVDLAYLREDLPALLSESAEGLGRVKRIVQDLKDFSRVDNTDWSEADINAGLDSTLNVVSSEVKYKAEIRKEYGVLPPVRCLAAQLNQVFMNFIVNAAHAIDGRGVITLSTGHAGDRVWVEVADTGCGMSAEVQRRIFEPFFTTKPVGKGTGLGLSLSFSIVQKHKGTIKVKSEPGKGSAFRVWIPVDCEAAVDSPPVPPVLLGTQQT